jgi:inosine-uridine nucleoside N-ribohydrolase
MTVTDFTAAEDTRNALVAMSVDVPAFWDLVLSAYARIPAAVPA